MKDFKISFIGIGAAKSGSTWLSSLLEQHPDIEFPHLKEVTFFNKFDFDGSFNKKYEYAEEYYHSLFKNKKHKCGEWSPHYLYDSHAAQKIKNYSQNVKLIVSLRNPVDRLYSHFLYDQHFNENISKKISFSKAVTKYNYLVDAGFYYNQLKNYFSIFPAENIKIIVFENAINKQQQTIKELYDFIGVNSDFIPDFTVKNKSKKVKFSLLNKILYIPGKVKSVIESSSNKGKFLMGAFEKSKVYKSLFYWKTKIKDVNVENLTKRKIEKSQYNTLFDLYSKDIYMLQEQYNVDVSRWKKQ